MNAAKAAKPVARFEPCFPLVAAAFVSFVSITDLQRIVPDTGRAMLHEVLGSHSITGFAELH